MSRFSSLFSSHASFGDDELVSVIDFIKGFSSRMKGVATPEQEGAIGQKFVSTMAEKVAACEIKAYAPQGLFGVTANSIYSYGPDSKPLHYRYSDIFDVMDQAIHAAAPSLSMPLHDVMEDVKADLRVMADATPSRMTPVRKLDKIAPMPG